MSPQLTSPTPRLLHPLQAILLPPKPGAATSMTQGKGMKASTGGSTLSPASPPAPHLSSPTTPLLQHPPKGMKPVLGSPGTWSGMALRVSQCVFAAVSFCAMVTTFGFNAINYFRYMNIMLILQFLWSLGLACLEIYAIRNRKDLRKHALGSVLVVGNWIMAMLTWAAASCSAGVGTLIVDNEDFCRRLLKEACTQSVLPIVLAFIAGLFAFASGFPMSSLQDSLEAIKSYHRRPRSEEAAAPAR